MGMSDSLDQLLKDIDALDIPGDSNEIAHESQLDAASSESPEEYVVSEPFDSEREENSFGDSLDALMHAAGELVGDADSSAVNPVISDPDPYVVVERPSLSPDPVALQDPPQEDNDPVNENRNYGNDETTSDQPSSHSLVSEPQGVLEVTTLETDVTVAKTLPDTEIERDKERGRKAKKMKMQRKVQRQKRPVRRKKSGRKEGAKQDGWESLKAELLNPASIRPIGRPNPPVAVRVAAVQSNGGVEEEVLTHAPPPLSGNLPLPTAEEDELVDFYWGSPQIDDAYIREGYFWLSPKGGDPASSPKSGYQKIVDKFGFCRKQTVARNRNVPVLHTSQKEGIEKLSPQYIYPMPAREKVIYVLPTSRQPHGIMNPRFYYDQ